MKLKKLLLSFALLAIAAFGMVGCANVEFIRAVDSQNIIIDKLVVEVDESKVNKSGVELNTVMSAINDDLIAFRLSVEKWKLQFISHKEIMDAIDKGIYVEVTIVKNKASVAVQFASWQMFGLFYGYAEIEDMEYLQAMEDVGPFIDHILSEEYENEKFGLFFMKYSIIRNSGIVGELEDFDFNDTNYYDKYVALTNNHYSLDDLDISQIFAYPDDRVYNNADNSYVEGGMTFMQWNISDKDDDFQMEIYKLVPTTVWWYALALLVSAIIIVVLIVVIYIKSKKEPLEKITRWDVERDGK